jgi:uncharacterized protein YgiB involved in biofilm formation
VRKEEKNYYKESFKSIKSSTLKNTYKQKSGDDYGKAGNGKEFRVSQGHAKGISYKNEIYG